LTQQTRQDLPGGGRQFALLPVQQQQVILIGRRECGTTAWHPRDCIEKIIEEATVQPAQFSTERLNEEA
jgi:hypothetical protein